MFLLRQRGGERQSLNNSRLFKNLEHANNYKEQGSVYQLEE